MIVRCPECSTGFKLPDNKVTEKPVKLRCSKCSHVFHFRLGDAGEAEVFHTDDDRAHNSKNKAESADAPAASEDASKHGSEQPAAPEEPAAPEDGPNPNKTQFGMPAASLPKHKSDSSSLSSKLSKKLSRSAASDYNPFPHANLDLKPNNETSLGVKPSSEGVGVSDPEEAWAEEATRVIDPEPGAEDPFAGAFDAQDTDAPDDALDVEEDPFAGAFADAPSAPIEEPAAPPAEAEEQAEVEAETSATAVEAQAAPRTNADPNDSAPGAESAAAQAAVLGAEAGASPFQPGRQSYRPEDMVDPSFGTSGPTFDPERGIVDAAAPPPAGATHLVGGPAATRSDAPAPQAAAAPAKAPAAKSPAPSASNPTPQPDAPAKARPTAAWEPDDFDEPISAHTIGGGGPQKAANIVLILLVVGLGFLGLIAALSGGVLDFKRFPHMLEVAFEGADFEPRSEWSPKAATQVVTAPENPIRIEGVFAQPVERAASDTVILVRGAAKNASETSFENVELRAILYDEQERVIAQTTALLGARVQPSALAEAESSKALLPTSATALTSHSTQPFSLIFEEVAPEVLKRGNLAYRVEVASKTP